MRLSDGIADEKAVELRAFNLFECLCRGSGVLDDGRDAGLLQRMADREPIHIVVVEHEDTRVCWRLAGLSPPLWLFILTLDSQGYETQLGYLDNANSRVDDHR